jgi:hypothetical protein
MAIPLKALNCGSSSFRPFIKTKMDLRFYYIYNREGEKTEVSSLHEQIDGHVL